MLERQLVPVRAVADEARGDEIGDNGVLSPLLPLVDVREVHLDDRDRERLECVVDRPRVVRPRRGVDDDAVDGVVRVVAPLGELTLVVRLAALDGQLELPRPLVDAALELGDRQPAVHLRIATAEHVEVDAVQDGDPHLINLSSSRRASSSGTATPMRGPSSPRRTKRGSPPRAFLSRFIAAQARSRSTCTGCGRSTSSTTAVSRPERRSAARSPSATARPCVSPSYPAADSSACANVCPRFSTVRSPRSYGSRRQIAALKAIERRTSSSPGSSQNGSPASRPTFTTSAIPSSRCGSGRVSSSAGSTNVRAGQWKAPTRFFPCGRSIAVLPPIAASTWATRLVGTGVQAMPRR